MSVKHHPDVESILAGTRDAITARRVYGEAYEKDGIAVIPAARVAGGGGGGGGEGTSGEGGRNEGSGSGVGYGLAARPVGAFVIKRDRVRWRPALDVTRVLIWGNIVAIVYFLTAWRIEVARARSRRRGRR